MPNSPEGDRADISCHLCRKRKVKCDRTVPQCRVCEQIGQPCTYPPGPLKPGPKLGSLHRKKRVRNRFDGEDVLTSQGWVGAVAAGHQPSALDDEGEEEEVEPDANDDDSAPTAEVKTVDLAFILHPSHEPSPSNSGPGASPEAVVDDHSEDILRQTRAALGMDRAEIEHLISIYFDNMVAINLFHEPSFADKLAAMKCPTQAAALLAAMFAFCARFSHQDEPQTDTNCRAAHFLNLALRLIDDAMKECGDRTPPLCVLQAAILTAFSQLTQGVLGRAWRALGTCVRLAYEMNLHLIDVQHPRNVVDIDRWCADEEKRRAWWAIWEMDVFATAIRRTPTAIAWSQMEVLLPVEDEYWFARTPRPSCFFQQDPTRRWQVLERSGNESAKAWFIVINSLMKEAQRISSPRGVPGRRPQSDTVDEARQHLEVIANAVRCFQLALPCHLKYMQQPLGFDARKPGEVTSKRQAHCSLYNIYVMTHLARLMICRYDVFKGRFSVNLPASRDWDDDSPRSEQDGQHTRAKEYFDAAGDILAIIQRSSDDHVRYIHPFLSNTIWLASAISLMRSQLCRPTGTQRSVLRSRYQVLHLTYKKCVSFWEMDTAVQQSLETLEAQVEAWQQQHDGSQPSRNLEEGDILVDSLSTRVGANPHSDNDGHGDAQFPKRRTDASTLLEPSAARGDHHIFTPPPFPTPPYSNRLPAASTWSSEDTFNGPILDLLPPIDSQPMASESQLLSSGTLIDPLFLFATNPPLQQLLDPNGFLNVAVHHSNPPRAFTLRLRLVRRPEPSTEGLAIHRELRDKQAAGLHVRQTDGHQIEVYVHVFSHGDSDSTIGRDVGQQITVLNQVFQPTGFTFILAGADRQVIPGLAPV
ncbi:fungal-specific transcription factor domain-containing protein [Aspergillus carlsbadensis]|nr:fungal-specific transcription factor domain-containing protein [Aspergillus carlsbadensis]